MFLKVHGDCMLLLDWVAVGWLTWHCDGSELLVSLGLVYSIC